MVIKDLKQICPQCRGSGRQAAISQWGISQINPSGRCHPCVGRGFFLTPLGEELVKLLRPFVMEIIDESRPLPAGPPPVPAGEGGHDGEEPE